MSSNLHIELPTRHEDSGVMKAGMFYVGQEVRDHRGVAANDVG